MNRPRVAAALIGSCLGTTGCGAADNEELIIAINLYWEEPTGVDGPESCQSAGVDFVQWKLLDEGGETIDCEPHKDGACIDAPTGDCLDRLEIVLPPGEYTLQLDGYRSACKPTSDDGVWVPNWHAECDSIFVDRFEERYGCIIDGTEACVDAGLTTTDAGVGS